MRPLVDAQLPAVLARRLEERGHEAWHVSDIGLQGATDNTVWSEALRRDCAIVTKDSDFAAWSDVGRHPAPFIVWVRCGNARNAELVDIILDSLSDVQAALAGGARVVEIVSPRAAR